MGKPCSASNINRIWPRYQNKKDIFIALIFLEDLFQEVDSLDILKIQPIKTSLTLMTD